MKVKYLLAAVQQLRRKVQRLGNKDVVQTVSTWCPRLSNHPLPTFLLRYFKDEALRHHCISPKRLIVRISRIVRSSGSQRTITAVVGVLVELVGDAVVAVGLSYEPL